MKALRYNEGKLQWNLIHYKSLAPMVQALMSGAQKYAPDNWKEGMSKKEILNSLMRHLTSLLDGETHDSESGLHHIGHILCNAMFYSFYATTKEGMDKDLDLIEKVAENAN